MTDERADDRPVDLGDDPIVDPLADLPPRELDVIRLTEAEAATADPEWSGDTPAS